MRVVFVCRPSHEPLRVVQLVEWWSGEFREGEKGKAD